MQDINLKSQKKPALTIKHQKALRLNTTLKLKDDTARRRRSDSKKDKISEGPLDWVIYSWFVYDCKRNLFEKVGDGGRGMKGKREEDEEEEMIQRMRDGEDD